MNTVIYKIALIVPFLLFSPTAEPPEFQGQAYYSSKSTMNLGRWGARMSEAQKKQVQARLKNRLEKTYVLNFSKTESLFNEEEKLDAISGATDSWGANFARGEQYKNVKEKRLVQHQEFYGKQFLVKDDLQKFDWKIGKESKQIGQYLCFKATTAVPSTELAWYNFSWGDLRNQQPKEDGTLPEVRMTTIEAWYTPQIPVAHGPAEYWGLPGLILEVNTDNTTMLCTKIILNPKGKINLEAPNKGKETTKMTYRETITEKMKEMRDNRGRRSGR